MAPEAELQRWAPIGADAALFAATVRYCLAAGTFETGENFPTHPVEILHNAKVAVSLVIRRAALNLRRCAGEFLHGEESAANISGQFPQ